MAYLHRRNFIKRCLCLLALLTGGTAGLLKPLLAFTQRNGEAFGADTEQDALAALFPGRQVEASDAVHIDAHDEIENGAFVPLGITTDLPSVASITILVAKNPNPLIAKFNLAPECAGFIETRIKVAEPSDIIAVVEAGNKLHGARKFVKVIEGGCG